MTRHPYKALYIHIPFCVKRCHYCDFPTKAAHKEDKSIDAYIENLVLEIRRHSKAAELRSIESIYIGGGTPSFIGSARILSLLYALSVSVDISSDNFEFSMEANPESLNERLVKDIWAMGVNRLSIGVQSFDDAVLQTLGRAHTAQEALHAIDSAFLRFENVSIDLMCGIPGQTELSFQQSLEQAIEKNIPHISVYPLSIEENTALQKQISAGLLPQIDEDEQVKHMLLAKTILEKAGYHRYEVASYALKDFECKHNKAYWTGVSYLGLGDGATSMIQSNSTRQRICNNEVVDKLNRKQMEAEDLMLGMRLTQGITCARILEAQKWLPTLTTTLKQLEDEAYIVLKDNCYTPTEKGWLFGNQLYGALMALAD